MKLREILILLVSALLPLSCKNTTQTAYAPKVVCVLLDISESTNSPGLRKAYHDDFRLVLSAMQRKDVLAAAVITEKSIGETSLPVEFQFPDFVPTGNPLYKEARERRAQKELQESKDSLLTVVDTVLLHPPRKVMRTDIFSSLGVAERIFKEHPLPRKRLVMISDMIEDYGEYNFELEELTPQRIRQIIKNEERMRRLPDLTGVDVYVMGAISGRPEKFYAIRDFWTQYFQRCGARVVGYGATSVTFNE